MNVDLGGNKIYVKVIYKNNRNIYMRFDENANLVVTCKRNTLDEEIVKLIEANKDSLLKMYKTALDKIDFNERFFLLGKEYTVVYDKNLVDVSILDNHIYAKDEEMLDKYVEDKYQEVFKKEAELCAKCFNDLPNYILKYRKMKTRWGVNNRRDNSITLNTELIKRDVALIDYVIIHEMAHFYEGNHSKAFWDIVKAACPDYKERRSKLRK